VAMLALAGGAAYYVYRERQRALGLGAAPAGGGGGVDDEAAAAAAAAAPAAVAARPAAVHEEVREGEKDSGGARATARAAEEEHEVEKEKVEERVEAEKAAGVEEAEKERKRVAAEKQGEAERKRKDAAAALAKTEAEEAEKKRKKEAVEAEKKKAAAAAAAVSAEDSKAVFAGGGANAVRYVAWDEFLGASYGEAAQRATLVVDCAAPGRVAPCLTHHREGAGELRDVAVACCEVLGMGPPESSTDLVLGALVAARGGAGQGLAGRVNAALGRTRRVTVNHFDADGLCCLYAVLHADEVVADAQLQALLSSVSRLGDFRELPPAGGYDAAWDLALKVCCWISAEERRTFARRPFERRREAPGTAREDRYAHFLAPNGTCAGLVQAMGSPQTLEDVWGPLYWRVVSAWRSLQLHATGAGRPSPVRVHEDCGLAVVEAPEPLPYYALHSATRGCDAVLTLYGGRRYELELKYTGFVDLYSRPTWPRLDLRPVCTRLNDLEQSRAARESADAPSVVRVWVADRITDSGPLMRLEARDAKLSKADRYADPCDRRILQSRLHPWEVEEVVLDHFRRALAFAAEQGGTPKVGWTWEELHELNEGVNAKIKSTA